MGEHNSPFFKAGTHDGARDRQLVEACPPGDPGGMDPGMSWSTMYQRGYQREFEQADWHFCTGRCRPR